MLDDLNNLPILDCQPDIPYRDMEYKLLWYNEKIGKGKVEDEDGCVKDIVAFANDLESIELLHYHKVVHWSKVGGILCSEPRFYAVGCYTRLEVNDLIICNDSWSMDFDSWGSLSVGDVVWFMDGVFHYSDKLLGLLPVIYGKEREILEDAMWNKIMNKQ